VSIAADTNGNFSSIRRENRRKDPFPGQHGRIGRQQQHIVERQRLFDQTHRSPRAAKAVIRTACPIPLGAPGDGAVERGGTPDIVMAKA